MEDELTEFVRARLDEANPAPGEMQDFTSWRHLAATWRDHPDYKPEWALESES